MLIFIFSFTLLTGNNKNEDQYVNGPLLSFCNLISYYVFMPIVKKFDYYLLFEKKNIIFAPVE
jgi:hypothetical protein